MTPEERLKPEEEWERLWKINHCCRQYPFCPHGDEENEKANG